jgi:hypothetical protein
MKRIEDKKTFTAYFSTGMWTDDGYISPEVCLAMSGNRAGKTKMGFEKLTGLKWRDVFGED